MVHEAPPNPRPDFDRSDSMSPEEPAGKDDDTTPLLDGGQDGIVQRQKPFTTLSAIGVAYGITNASGGIPLVLSTTMPLGGSSQVFWSFLLMAVVALATTTTLAELISAMPHPGGQYMWVNKLAPARYRRALSYTTAMMGWISAVACGAAGSLTVPINVFTIVSMLNPNFVYQRWMGFVMFQVINIVTCFAACFEHALPKMADGLLLFNVLTAIVVVITLFAMAKTRTDTQDFFRVVNVSGWPNGVAFIIGCNGPNWCLSSWDAITHLAEEIPSPSTNLPRALMWTVVVAASSGFLVVLAVLVNLGPIDFTDYSGIGIFYQITGNRAAAIALWIPILVSVSCSVWGVQIWQSRLAWTISRESGFPLHRHFSKLFAPPFYTPIWSLIGSAVGTALMGFVYLASELAFSSLTATGILLQYFSYSIPTILLLWQGRSKFRHGPFWYPGLGLLANIVMLVWVVVASVFYCFPANAVVYADQMNYCSGVLVLIGVFIASLWFFYARDNYEVIEIIEANVSAQPNLASRAEDPVSRLE